MGTDVWGVIEERDADGWKFCAELPDIGRDYLMFATLTGTRNRWGLTPIAQDRGFPRDMNAKTRDVCGDGYGTWLTADELRTGLALYREACVYAYGTNHDEPHQFDDILATMDGRGKPARLVLLFC